MWNIAVIKMNILEYKYVCIWKIKKKKKKKILTNNYNT